MEIIGLTDKEKKQQIDRTVGSLDALTKALIITYQVTDKEKANKLKQDYLKEIIETAIEKSLKDKSNEEKKTILAMEELELEIQQRKVDTINQIMGDENGK